MAGKTNIVPGAKYGEWEIVSRVRDPISGKSVGWNCKCSCDDEKIVLIKNISTVINGSSTSCGCARKALLETNNPMFKEETRLKVSAAHKADPNRSAIVATAVQLAQTPAAKAKRIATNTIAYGGNAPACSPVIQQKIADTNTVKYGGIAPIHSQITKDKMDATMMARYGVNNIMELYAFRQLVGQLVSNSRRTKGVQTLSTGKALVDVCKDKGFLATSARNVCRKYGQEVMEQWLENYDKSRSSLERYMVNALISAGMTAEHYNKIADCFQNTEYRYMPDILVKNGDKKCYVDVDGLYFHSGYEKKYHIDKCDAYLECDSQILQFREDEVLHKTDIVVSMISGKLGLNKSIGARECTVGSVAQKDADVFLLENHLMGTISAKHIGLYLDSELVCLMSHKTIGPITDISRFCTKCKLHVSGGLSRLLSYVKADTKCKFIQYFVDRRYGNGASVLGYGFKCDGITLGWHWTDGDVTFNRQACKANMDDRGLTELQHAAELGWTKIYDAGQAKYVYIVDDN